jgi:L-amino acid N-acyltransferase YncA
MQSAPFHVRDSTEADIAQITAIYAHYVRTHTATFEIDPPDEAEMKSRWSGIHSAGFPYVVAESNQRVLGYCYVSWYRLRPAYRYTLENSVYVAPENVHGGVGHALLDHVLKMCERAGYREIIAIIGDSDNAPSIGLHRKAGFAHVGTLRNVGYKFDRWLDSVVMQRSLSGASS